MIEIFFLSHSIAFTWSSSSTSFFPLTILPAQFPISLSTHYFRLKKYIEKNCCSHAPPRANSSKSVKPDGGLLVCVCELKASFPPKFGHLTTTSNNQKCPSQALLWLAGINLHSSKQPQHALGFVFCGLFQHWGHFSLVLTRSAKILEISAATVNCSWVQHFLPSMSQLYLQNYPVVYWISWNLELVFIT